MITCVNVKGFLPNLVHALILRSGLGLLMDKFRECLRVICPRHDTIMAGYYSLTFLFFPENWA